MNNSSLVTYTKISPNKTIPRNKTVDRITPHCVVGHCTVETLGDIFHPTSRKASSNYGIDDNGKVGMYVEEKDRSWCSSSSDNDNRAITIEIASDKTEPYAMSETAYNKFIELCVDICKRYNKTKLLWITDKEKALAYKPKDNEMLLTVHRWFANKSCPGNWLYNRLGEVAETVTKKLVVNETTETKPETRTLYCVQVGAFSKKQNAINLQTKLKSLGFDTYITTKNV